MTGIVEMIGRTQVGMAVERKNVLVKRVISNNGKWRKSLYCILVCYKIISGFVNVMH